MFHYHVRKALAGLFILHVGDFRHGGTESFRKCFVNVVYKKFKIGSQCIDCFKYTGLEVTHGKYITITLAQKEYTGSVSKIALNITRQMHKNDMLNEEAEIQLKEQW